MKPIEFKEQTMKFGENQKEYGTLPAFRDREGQVITCWELEEGELEQIQKTGKVYLRQLTFNQPLQPVSLHIASPFVEPEKTED